MLGKEKENDEKYTPKIGESVELFNITFRPFKEGTFIKQILKCKIMFLSSVEDMFLQFSIYFLANPAKRQLEIFSRVDLDTN